MGDPKLYLLLLLCISLTFAQDEEPTCMLAKRYKTLHKYLYQYEAESLNAINGASALKNGPKGSCKVEIEVPQACSFIVRTSGCTLSEVDSVDADGNTVFRPAASSDAFAAEMEKYALKVQVNEKNQIKLYPEEGETTTILNIKRGIISALAAPGPEDNRYTATIHGLCKNTYSLSSPAEMTMTRDLSGCDHFAPLRDQTSPLALITGLHYPLAQLVRSTQACNYKFDEEQNHITSGTCTEKHILLPFSSQGEYGVTNIGKQEVTLIEVAPHNDRVFDLGPIVKDLHIDMVEDRTMTQDKDTALELLRKLATLPETEGETRAHLFHKLVMMVRGMKLDTLNSGVPDALTISPMLTYQVLVQCGTPECSSAIMELLRGRPSSGPEVDAFVYAMGLVSNPSPVLINDMLKMAQQKPSKPVMYALSNVVNRFYKAEGQLVPEIFSVASFMAGQIGDCSGDKDQMFLTLRVIGNMAPAMANAGPAVRGAVLQCVNKPEAAPEVQQAAIQVFRLAPVPEEGRETLMQVLLDSSAPVQKRIAAYLVLMKDPQPSELAQLMSALATEPDAQLKNFIISHINNIGTSTEPDTQELRQKIVDATTDNTLGPAENTLKVSRNLKIGLIQSNMIFEGASYLPKEVMLEMTLKAFGFDLDMMEIGMEGKGFEPTVEALFGENGFFPDTTLKTMYFVSDNMPLQVSQVLQNVLPAMRKDRKKRQTSQNLVKDIGQNLKKLVDELKTSQAPEATVYLRLLGNELGYMKTNEMEEMAYSAAMLVESMLKMFPVDVVKALTTMTDTSLYAHYIFMDNEFFLPTLTGVPLRIALSGTFAPGFKGGLKISPEMNEVAFMPSAGVEFLTQVGTHIPEYVDSGLEMHTNIFHESGLSAKVTIEKGQVQLRLPAPQSATKLIHITNSLVARSGAEIVVIPPNPMDTVSVNECTPFFSGMKYCYTLNYNDAWNMETTPYFPFTGDSKFAMELVPTGDVTEYTATLAYELLREGEEGKQKVDAFKFILRAEGAEPTEATAMLKYNRRRNVVTAEVLIPDYDVEAGLRLGVVDGNTKGKGTHSISLDLINKNIPQVSLVGRAKLSEMKEGMLQLQMLVPVLSTDATFTANLKRDEEIEVELKSDIKIMEATSEQKLALKYDGSKIEAVFKSDMNAETANLPIGPMLASYGEQILDTQVGETDMKVRHIFTKLVEASNNYMEKYGADLPYIQNFRVPDMPEMTLPEKLFLNTETKAVYYFNNERWSVYVPVPFGGKSTNDFNFPEVLNTPQLSVPQIGLEIVSMEIPVPELFVPEGFPLYVPLFGKAEISAILKSNLYDMEATMAAGKDVVETPSYSATIAVAGTSPIDILSVKFEGSGMVVTADVLKAQVKASFMHKFLEANVNIVEEASLADKLIYRCESKIDATSPLGVNVAVEYNGAAGLNTETLTIDSNLNGVLKAGPVYGKAISIQSASIAPFTPQAKIESSVEIDSTFFKAQNTFNGELLDGTISVLSNTNAFDGTVVHIASVDFKDQKLTIKSDANTEVMGLKMKNQIEAAAGAGEVVMRMETNSDYAENRVYSLMITTLNTEGLAVNSDATLKLLNNEAIHKANIKLTQEGLVVSGTNTLQSPLSVKNTFNGVVDTSKATLSFTNKAALNDMKADNANSLTLTLSSIEFTSKAEAMANEDNTYIHDIAFDMKPYIVSANVNNNLKLLSANFINEAQLQAELYKIDLTGSVKAIFGEEEIKHIYQINYNDMTANAKCSTTGKVFGTHMNHNTELEVIGLAARFSNDARFNSQPMRFDNTIRCSIVPFDFNLDAIFNADGDLILYGKHSAQLYAKFLAKAQPLAFASTQEWRASMNHALDNGMALESTFDNKMDTAVSLEEQKTSFRMKSKMNNHAINQDMSLYNTAERMGVEMSNALLTNLLNQDNEDNQEFAISGFVKYDKNTNIQVIQLPLMQYFPIVVENLKGAIVSVAEGVLNFINDEEVRANLEAIPQLISNFIVQLNLEEKINGLKQFLSDLTQEYAVSVEDVEVFVRNLNETVKNVFEIVSQYVAKMKEIMGNMTFPDTIVQKIQEQLLAIDEAYEIRPMIVNVLESITEMIQQINMEKLRGSVLEILINLDNQLEITKTVTLFLDKLKSMVQEFDFQLIYQEFRKIVNDRNIAWITDEFIRAIPTEMFSDATAYAWKVMQDLDIVGKFNAFYSKVREMLVQLEVDKKVQVLLEKAVEVIKQVKVEETISAVVQMAKDSEIPTRVMETAQSTIEYIKTTEMKDIIANLNALIESLVQKLNSMEYNELVNNLNQLISQYTAYINDAIKTLEIPEKLVMMKDFANYVLSTVRDITASLREVKISEIVKSVQDMAFQVVDYSKTLVDYVKQTIEDLNIQDYIQFVSSIYRNVVRMSERMVINTVDYISNYVPDQKFLEDVKQMFSGIMDVLRNAELNTPSFTVPLTDLEVPTMKFKPAHLEELEIPTTIDIPEFIILGKYTVPATTIAFADIKQKIFELIDYIMNFKMVDVEALFGDLSFNFLPPMPEIAFPEFTLPEISFPAFPEVPVEKLVKSLQVPEIKLPTIPTEITIPSFGKLYGEFRVQTPMYTTKTTAELQNSTENEETPQMTAFIISQGVSAYDIFNYKIDSTARLAVPKMSRVVFGETVKFEHVALGVEHQGSLNFYGKSAQAQAKTTVKVTTTPYSGEFMNTGFIALEDGMSASLETTCNHIIDVPAFDVKIEANAAQKAIARLDGLKLTLTVDNTGKTAYNGEEGNHKSNLDFTFIPSMITLTFNGDTDSAILKMKQVMNAEASPLSYVKFNIRNEAETPFLKSSEIVAVGQANLFDMKVDITANHNSELVGLVQGNIVNDLKYLISPREFTFELKNKGANIVNFLGSLTAKLDSQSEVSAYLNPEMQKINSFNMVRFNKNMVFFNITMDNSEKETAVILGVDGQANLDFLTSPISIPEIDLPFIDFRTPEVSNLNLYEQTILKDILTTTEQSVSLDAKVAYQKSMAPRLFDIMGLIQVPDLGNLLTELTFKSAIINLNINTVLETEDDIVFRLGATTASVSDSLKAKLDGTTSLTTRRGIKLANSLSLENKHFEGTHDSTVSVGTETYETTVSVVTVGKVALPILNMEINQNLVADNKAKPNAACTFRVNAQLNVPRINAVVKAEADHSTKMEGTFEYLSMETTNRANMDGTFLEDYMVLGMLDNDLNVYLNKDGLRCNAKVIADTKLNQETNKLFAVDVNENLAIEADLSRVYAVLKYTGNNEANLFSFNTKGRHVAQGTIDFAPISSLTADIEIDLAQPTNFGDLTVYEKATAELTGDKQKAASTSKFVSPVYTTNLVVEVEGDYPVLKVIAKSSATSPLNLLEYDMDASSTTSYENDAVNMNSKVVLTNAAMTMDVTHVITQALRKKRQADESLSRHTLNMDVNSPTFTDMNFRYAAGRNGISASLSSPSAGFLGLQVNGKIPTQMTGRLYGRYPSAPEDDVDILVLRSSPKDSDKMTLQVAYNMEAPKAMLNEFKAKIPAILVSLRTFVDNNLLTSNVLEWRDAIVARIDDAYNAAINYDAQLSQLSVFFRNFIVEFQKNAQAILDAAVKVLRETQFQLPGSEELTTLPVVLKELTTSIANVLRNTIQIVYDNMDYYYNTLVDNFSTVELRMPVGDVMTIGQIIDNVKSTCKSIVEQMVDFVNNMESLDTMLVKLSETLKAVVDKTQDFVDSIKSDYLDAVLANVNEVYRGIVTAVKGIADRLSTLNTEDLNGVFEYVVDMFIYVVDQFNATVNGALQQVSEEAQQYVKASDGKLEVEMPFPFLQ
ncbi:apolipoprotein Bb, tandem duplicate 1 [Eucyclogobius newberryi]|uniref:apolipoprotein Bb, tandem duplicate 1 n=1 Tax=Eucyclogobius newberryi TaxID=166745 RepID=UPI003B5C0C95